MIQDLTKASQVQLLAEAKRCELTTEQIGVRVSRATNSQLRKAIEKHYKRQGLDPTSADPNVRERVATVVKAEAKGPGPTAARKRQDKAAARNGKGSTPKATAPAKAAPVKGTLAGKDLDNAKAVFEGRIDRGEQWPALAKRYGFGDNWRKARLAARRYAAEHGLPDPQQKRGGPAPSAAIAKGSGRKAGGANPKGPDAAVTEAVVNGEHEFPVVYFRHAPGGYEVIADGGEVVEGEYRGDVLWTGPSLSKLTAWKREHYADVPVMPKCVRLPDRVSGAPIPGDTAPSLHGGPVEMVPGADGVFHTAGDREVVAS